MERECTINVPAWLRPAIEKWKDLQVRGEAQPEYTTIVMSATFDDGARAQVFITSDAPQDDIYEQYSSNFEIVVDDPQGVEVGIPADGYFDIYEFSPYRFETRTGDAYIVNVVCDDSAEESQFNLVEDPPCDGALRAAIEAIA